MSGNKRSEGFPRRGLLPEAPLGAQKFASMYRRFIPHASLLKTWQCGMRNASNASAGASNPEQSVPTRNGGPW